MAISEKSYGADHPDVAVGFHNLAMVLCDTDQRAEAERLFRRALEIFTTSGRTENPTAINTLRGLAALLQQDNRPEEAEPLLQRARAINDRC